MDSSTRLDIIFHRPPEMAESSWDAPLCGQLASPVQRSDLVNTPRRKNSAAIGDSGKAGSSLAGALLEHTLRYRPGDPSPLPKRGPVYSTPIEILLRIFQLVAPSHTRNGLYDILKLTHICRFWRMALINQPRVWSTISITRKDRRSFVKACVERSHPVALDVTVDASKVGRIHSGCTCDKGRRERLLPNESNPCEWHFQFEPLAEIKHSDRIHALNISFENDWPPSEERAWFALGSCRFFTSTFPRLTTLVWKNEWMKHAKHLFSTPPFVPTLRSLTYVGSWNGLTAPVNNLTSFVFEGNLGPDRTRTEDFRSFLFNNRSLESLGVKYAEFEGDSIGPPVCLSNLKSLDVGLADNKLPTMIRAPALRHLSSLRIGSDDDAEYYTLYATGDGIVFSASCPPSGLTETWEDFTRYARPTIHHVHLEDSVGAVEFYSDTTFASVLLDAHTLEIGDCLFPFWYGGFLDDLKQLGPQLKTTRFAISEELDPFPEDGDDTGIWGGELFDGIEELVRYRFSQGRPFSAVERMVTSKSERTNRGQDFVWRCFYNSRELGRYVQPA